MDGPHPPGPHGGSGGGPHGSGYTHDLLYPGILASRLEAKNRAISISAAAVEPGVVRRESQFLLDKHESSRIISAALLRSVSFRI